MSLGKRCGAEFFGTFWLVFGGCGSAVLAAGFPQLGIGFAGVALAFGLTLLTMAYAIGHISGCISTRRFLSDCARADDSLFRPASLHCCSGPRRDCCLQRTVRHRER